VNGAVSAREELRPWRRPRAGGGCSVEPGRDALDERDFERLARLIGESCGIKMPPQKRTMLETRLRKRLRSLELGSFAEYCAYLFSPAGEAAAELVQLIDVVTTNKTDFFREPAHFDFLSEVALPRLVQTYGVGRTRPLRAWSAACSTGEEPYTLAMVLAEYAAASGGFDFSILATDVSTRVLEHARLGIYSLDKIAPVVPALRRKYLLRSRDPQKKEVRIVPELRARVAFRRLNFLDGDYGVREPIDLLFCRNVLIYFDRPTQERLLGRLCRHLAPGRYLFTGHSETLGGMDLPLTQVAPSVYRKV